MRRRQDIAKILTYALLAIASLVWLFPLVWLVATAFKSQAEVFARPLGLLPSAMRWDNFARAWSYAPFAAYYWNTIVIVVGLLVVQLVTMTMAAYAFARLQFPGRDLLFLLFLAQLMITPQSTILPNYITVSSLRLLDTRLAVMIPYFASAFGTFLMRQAFLTIPADLEDAASIDGCNILQYLWHVALPIVRPAWVAFSIISVTFHWNEFFWPLIVTETARSRPLTVGLTIFAQQSEGGAEWHLLMAATMMVVAPLLLGFVLFQRQFVQSFMRSGLKG
jgi:sn-glycerol 3-phosphate transport system permease protein